MTLHPSARLRRAARQGVLLLLLLATPTLALAQQQNMGQMATGIFTQLGPIADLLMAASFLAGIFAFIKGGVVLLHHGKDPDRNPVKNAVIFFVASALFIGLPAGIMMAQSTLFTNGAHTGVTQNLYNQIN